MSEKAVLRSKTIVGIVLTLAALVFGWTPELQGQLSADAVQGIEQAGALAGLALATWGRVKANSKLKGVW